MLGQRGFSGTPPNCSCRVRLLAFLVAPIIILIPLSLTSGQYLAFPPPGYSLQWYRRIFSAGQWVHPIWISVRVALAMMLMGTALGVLTSLALNPVLRGWWRYFRIGDLRRLGWRLDRWVLRRLRAYMAKRWRTVNWRRYPDPFFYRRLGLHSLQRGS